MNGLVSVIVPTYNMAGYLPLAIQSVLDQTYRHLEIHVVDDGSTDSTREVMNKYVGDERVHYHFQQNRGLPAARNTGIRAAKGGVIALCDADDMWVPNKLELQLPRLWASPTVGVVYTEAEKVDMHGHRLPDGKAWGSEYRVSGWITNQLFVRNVVTGCTSVIRRECFDKVGFYDESLTGAEDYDLWLRISTAYEFVYVPEVTYLYRQWEGQMTRNGRKMLENCVRVLSEFEKNYPDSVARAAVDEGWALMFVNRGLGTMSWKKDRLSALKDICRALQRKPSYVPAWKAAVKVLLNRV
jgi:glycosyltransferase involved in cell wall biosynthesis